MRRGQWKLVVRQLPPCLAPNDCEVRLYLLNEPVPPNQPGIELPDGSPGVWDPLSDALPALAREAYVSLKNELVRTLVSERKSLAHGDAAHRRRAAVVAAGSARPGGAASGRGGHVLRG
jgi:hypothetical protein